MSTSARTVLPGEAWVKIALDPRNSAYEAAQNGKWPPYVVRCPKCGRPFSILQSGDTAHWGPPEMWRANYHRRLERARWLAEHHCHPDGLR